MDVAEENFTEEEKLVEAEDVNDAKQEQTDDVGVEFGEKRWPGWPGESVFRILVPGHKVGGLIGRKGEYIKKICEESKARIKILEAPAGVPERAVIISAKEEPDVSVPPAIDGLLRVHKHIINNLDGESAHPPQGPGNVVNTRLLVASTQAGSLIGKQGATIKSIQDASNSVVRILENLPPVALQDDRIVEIQGDPIGRHKAVELIALHLRKFLVDRSVLQLFEKPILQSMHMEQRMPPPQSWGPPQGLPPSGVGSGYGGRPQYMPPRPHDQYYPPPDLSPLDKQPHHGISMYEQNAPHIGIHSTSQQSSSRVSQVTHHMQISLSYTDAVIGAAGANISYIRRSSGAAITIQETRGVPGEMTVEITGSAAQVQTAQQLIQNFMVDAAPAPAAPTPSSMAPVDQGYGSYPSHGTMYGSPPANAGPAHNGGYGSAYGNSYGY